MTDARNNTVAMTVRFEPALGRQIKEAAEAAERSVSREIVFRLKGTFAKQEPSKADDLTPHPLSLAPKAGALR